jgi:hypothetical protein
MTRDEPEFVVTVVTVCPEWLPVARDHIASPAPVVQVPELIEVHAPPL